MKYRVKIVLSILFLFAFLSNVNASSYSMTLSQNKKEIENNKIINIDIILNNIEIKEGINVCEFELEYENLKINSIKGKNDWVITEGNKIIADSPTYVKDKIVIGTIDAKVLKDSKITIKNINCTDGTNEYQTNNNTIHIKTTKETKKEQKGEKKSNSFITITLTLVTIILITILILKKYIKRSKRGRV